MTEEKKVFSDPKLHAVFMEVGIWLSWITAKIFAIDYGDVIVDKVVYYFNTESQEHVLEIDYHYEPQEKKAAE